MNTRNPRQGTALFSALLFLIGTGVVVQLWLLSIAVNTVMAHDYALLNPTLVGSCLILIINAALVALVFDFDKKSRGRE